MCIRDRPPTGQPVEDVDGEPSVYPADERPAQIDQTVQLPLIVTPLVECGQSLVVIGAEVEEQLGRFLAGRVELRAHLRRIEMCIRDRANVMAADISSRFTCFIYAFCFSYFNAKILNFPSLPISTFDI